MPLTINAAIKRTRLDLDEAKKRVEVLTARLQALEDAELDLGIEYEPRRVQPLEVTVEARTDAIINVMRSQPTTIWTASRLKGPVGSRRSTIEETKDLAAALSYLGSQRKIWSPRRGEWLLWGMADEMATLEVVEPDPDPNAGPDAIDVPF